jgi:capsular exopolysaccharide synthesis family protein
LVAPAIIAPLLTAGLAAGQPVTYEATARVLLGAPMAGPALATDGATPGSTWSRRDLVNETKVATGDAVAGIISEQLDLAPAALPTGQVTAHPEADVLAFTFNGSTATEAAFFANTWANAYVELKEAEAQQVTTDSLAQLQSKLSALRASRTDLRASLSDMEVRLAGTTDPIQRSSLQRQIDQEESAIAEDLAFVDTQISSTVDSITAVELQAETGPVGGARVVQDAVAPPRPIGTPLVRNIILSLAGGIILGVGLTRLVDKLDRSIRTAGDVERLGVSVLGSIPAAPANVATRRLATITLTCPRSAVSEAYQTVRSALQFAMLGHNVSSIVVTSPNRGDGKTATAVNLALAVAATGRRVILADTDFKQPQLHSIFKAAPTPGISDALLDEIPLAKIAVKHPQLTSTLAALPAGTRPPNPAAILASPPFQLLLTDLDIQCDLTVVDAAPMLPNDDALALASQLGGVVLVVRARRTTRKDLLQAVERIEGAGGQLLGVVVNGVKTRSLKSLAAWAGFRPTTTTTPNEPTDPGPTSDTKTDHSDRPAIEHASPADGGRPPASKPKTDPSNLASSGS